MTREELIVAIVESRFADTKKEFKAWRSTARKGRKEYLAVMDTEGKRMSKREKLLKAAHKRTGKRFYGKKYHAKATGVAMDYATKLDVSMAKRKKANKTARRKFVRTALGG